MSKPIPVELQFNDQQKQQVMDWYAGGKTHQEIGELSGHSRRTIMKLCKTLGLQRTPQQAASIKNSSPLDKPEIIQQIRSMRNTHNLSQISKIVGGSVSAINRICKKHNIFLDHNEYAITQSIKMRNTWTPAKREMLSGSIYPQLNDPIWLQTNYSKMSMGKLAKLIGAPVCIVSHHLKRHNIKLKTKDEYLRDLRREDAKVQIIHTKWGNFSLKSQNEIRFVNALMNDASVQTVSCEPITLTNMGSQYVPDFKVDGQIVEIKPPEYAKLPGIDRQRFVKQLLVAQANQVPIKCWYKGKYYDYDPVTDVDRYYCLNWKLLFNSSNECLEFLFRVGFMEPKWHKDKLLLGLKNLFSVKDPWNANCPNASVIDLIKHFSPHFWRSTHREYLPVSVAFEPGNTNILKQAIQLLWQEPREVNIYGLLKTISKFFKDFSTVSIFKPWVAQAVYNKLLPHGGVIVDPCMGWGGRLLGTLDSKYQYLGSDLNPNVIESHLQLRSFIGSRILSSLEPSFTVADATQKLAQGDLLFTSPPYDDCERYHGVDSHNTVTKPILNSIFTNFLGTVALNLPRRQEIMCTEIAVQHGWTQTDNIQMKTASFQGREKTYEPILVFKRQ